MSGGTIGWLDRREPRGQPLDVLPRRGRGLVTRHVVFGRVIAPDPARPLRIAVTLSHSRRGHLPKGVCTWVIMRGGGAGGGCAVRADMFAHGPIVSGMGLGAGSNEFQTVIGLASDDVARIVAFLAGGQTMPVSLADNVYVVDLARSRLPARLVAYDAHGRVIGFTPTIGDFDGGGAGPARGRARLLLHGVSPTGTTAALFVGRSTSGGRCMFLRWHRNKHEGGVMESCSAARWRGPPLQLSPERAPPDFVAGAVRPDVAAVVVRFADGTRATVAPTDGFVLYMVPRRHLGPGHQAVGAAGRNSAGATIGRESFLPRRH